MTSQKTIRETVENRMKAIYNNIRNAQHQFQRNNIPKATSYLLDVRLDADSVCRWIGDLK